jgi:hypothetical protein
LQHTLHLWSQKEPPRKMSMISSSQGRHPLARWPTLLCKDLQYQGLQVMCEGMICNNQAHLCDSQLGYQQVQWGVWCLSP